MVNILSGFAQRNNVITGTCDAAPLDGGRLSASPFVPFVKADIRKRIDPTAVLEGARSVIVIGVPWVLGGTYEREGAARVSSLGVNHDYHPLVKGLLGKLAGELAEVYDFRYKIFVDSPFLDERAFAHRAGIGFFGRNKLIISRRFGTRFNIGLMVTDLDVGEGADAPPQGFCPENCRLCIDACPTNALRGDVLDASRCCSYITQKVELEPGDEILIGNQIYGCDICQDVCPFNPPINPAFVAPDEILKLDDAGFEEQFRHTAASWRGVKILRRNAGIVLGSAK